MMRKNSAKKTLAALLLLSLLAGLCACGRTPAPTPWHTYPDSTGAPNTESGGSPATEPPQRQTCPDITGVPYTEESSFGEYLFLYGAYAFHATIRDGEAFLMDMPGGFEDYEYTVIPAPEDIHGLVVPASVNGAPVVEFDWDGGDDVTYPDTVRYINHGFEEDMDELHGWKTNVLTISAQVEEIELGMRPYGGNGIGFSWIGRYEVDPANRNYSSPDGVLYNKDQTRLIAFPMAMEAEKYEIPSTVQEIDWRAFWLVSYGTEWDGERYHPDLVIPPSVTVFPEIGWNIPDSFIGVKTIYLYPGTAAEAYFTQLREHMDAEGTAFLHTIVLLDAAQ